MSYKPTEPDIFQEPPEGWCDELFKAEPSGESQHSVAPIIKWYNCRLPKGHPESQDHTCWAFRLGK